MVQDLVASESKQIVYEPMSKSRAVVKVNPFNSCSTVQILGIGKGFLTSRLFTSPNLRMKHTVFSFLGIMKEGEAHCDAG